jgi:ribosomal-protein-alanine N-acetyltransferase
MDPKSDSSTPPPTPPHLLTERLLLRLPGAADAPRLLAFMRENEEFLKPWSPPLRNGMDSEEFWLNSAHGAQLEFREGRSLRLVLLQRDDAAGEIVGTCNFNHILRGPFQACYLGYQLAEKYEGRGLMQEALERAIRYVFDELCLHRIMANYMPHNVRSGHLLSRLGFRVEGTAKDYLFIDGAWRDHVLTSLANPNWREFRWY